MQTMQKKQIVNQQSQKDCSQTKNDSDSAHHIQIQISDSRPHQPQIIRCF